MTAQSYRLRLKLFLLQEGRLPLVVTGLNCTPLGSRKSRSNNNQKNNTNSLNLAQSQKSTGRSTSSHTNKGSRKSSNGQSGNLNKVEIKHLLEQLISLCY
ncbi:hypothetical protein RclHR1_04370004 [Rhizophagus clarus]|uniref:Uncharacterized protein n=1 Tax=Rhizophagus clarus TaxID=94130 RepID=A0A2Z6RLM6_9GLOM|nr:hypothetical protein RclHR1_04370004 [Rhizophagus clarus]GES94630.1 hypothetical protein RCL_e18543_RclHR1_04370004 [Rhizophagus clarus]